MKICISSEGPGLDVAVDPRFGRCRYFVIVDTDTMDYESHENANIMASGGAGIQAAQFIADKGIAAVATGNVGPNAYTTLEAAGIAIITGISGTVRDAVDAFKRGELSGPASGPTVNTNFGIGAPGQPHPDPGERTQIGRGMGMGPGMSRGRGKGGGRGMGCIMGKDGRGRRG